MVSDTLPVWFEFFQLLQENKGGNTLTHVVHLQHELKQQLNNSGRVRLFSFINVGDVQEGLRKQLKYPQMKKVRAHSGVGK